MAVTGHESSDDLKFQLAKRLYTAVVLNSSILKVKDVLKIIEIERIVNLLRKRSLWNGIRAFLQYYPCSFLVMEESGCAVIKPIVTIEFCRDFDGKRGCMKTFCSKLHVCRHFVKGKCTFGPRCKKPHHFQNESTREVLKKHFLSELNDEQAREFLCRNVQHFLDPELANAELPKSLEICKYYNVATGCTRDFCPYIHVCRFFAEEGNCKFGGQCIRKHDINNVHSRILLHRYHMDHLNEQQVLAYLKIKGENRDQQQPEQQQQQQQNGNVLNNKDGSVSSSCKPQSLASSNTSLNVNSVSPQYPSSHFPSNPLFGSLQSLMNDRNSSRKLSQPAQGINGLSMMDSLNQPRKLSLPTPPMTHSAIYRPKEENTAPVHVTSSSNHMMLSMSQSHNGDSPILSSRNSQNFKASSWSADIDNNFNNNTTSTTTPLMSHAFVNTNSTSSYLSDENFRNSNRFPISTSSGHQVSSTYNDSLTHHMTRDFHQSFSLNDAPDTNSSSRFSSSLLFNGLGLHNLSLPTSTSGNGHTPQNISNNNNNNNQRFHITDSFDTTNNTTDTLDTEDQNSTTSSSLPFSNSLRSQTNSLFTNRNPILRTSSNDIISPTGSSSSINGNNNNGRSPVFDINDPFSDWHENGERIFKSFSSKDNENDFNLSYYRTRSLPNFETTSLYKNVDNLKNEKTSSVVSDGSFDQPIEDCVCHKTEICIQSLSKNCKFLNCKKQHSSEPYVWQIASIPSKKSYNNFKNENFDDNKSSQKLAWINIDDNECIKLELAYCSVELEQSELELYGDNIMINFEDMTGEGRWDITSSNQTKNARSCDLSAWLLQASDEVPSRRNSQDAVFYHVRRLATSSSVCEDFDVKYATQWCWYWQDSFGMWRSYPKIQSDVIETTKACISDDIEAKYLAGHDQCLFEEQKMLFDFKSMVQINRQTGKQKRIRRRPQFITKEQRMQILSPTDSYTDISTDFARPWYWKNETNGTSNNSTYKLVDVDETSEMLSNVRHHFSRSMIGKTYEIISVKLVQNNQLWTKYMRLRSQLKSSGVKIAEKFVFKCMTEGELSGVCQQGFQMCTCKPSLDCTAENSFATEAKNYITDNDNENGEIKYMFCVRMAVPLSDLKDKSCGSSILTDKVEEEDEDSSSDDENNWVPSPTLPNKNSNLLCRHSDQVYPEFLIVFRI